MSEPYGLPTGSAIDYGTPGFPDWVYQLGDQWGLRASTYPGHQEADRPDINAAPNPNRENRGIDWAGPPQRMLEFARWLRDTGPQRTPGAGYGAPGLEMVIYQDPRTGERVGYPSWVDYGDDYPNHTDHVHTRQSASLVDSDPSNPHPPEPRDTLFADVSEFQVPADDSYPYRVLSIRSNDGTHLDRNFARNYQWCVNACDSGRLAFFIVYFYWRPGAGDVDNHIAMVTAQGGPHPRMVSMMDVERGGNSGADQSIELNSEYARLADWLGNEERVIAYANLGDGRSMWQFRPESLDWIIAGYGNNPSDPAFRKIAHQYTDGQGYGGGLPEGCPPFGNCDMNSADGLTATQFAAVCGIDTGADDMALINEASRSIYRDTDDPIGPGTEVDYQTNGMVHEELVERRARDGDQSSIDKIRRVAEGKSTVTLPDWAQPHAQAVLEQIGASK